MGLFEGLIVVLSMIGVVIASFIVGAIFGFVALYFAIRKFCPEAWLALDLKVHSNNQESVLKDMADSKCDESVEEECA